ncbi:hypothetical protein [Streptomyces sp. NPDC047841]|uniref:hypothetical protein n=1 Tax=Streptomyces sp. NPDC047841 TaxID=3154708 RepID=UPI0034514D74
MVRIRAGDEWAVMCLSGMLDDAGSAYQGNEAEDGLEDRIPPAAREAACQTITDVEAVPAAVEGRAESCSVTLVRTQAA